MNRKSKLLLLSFFICGVIIILITSLIKLRGAGLSVNKDILGEVVQRKSIATNPPIAIPSATTYPTPTVIPYMIKIIYAPVEIIEGEMATFTWEVNGPKKTINTSTIYYGKQSDAEQISKSEGPDVTKYTDNLTDFMEGKYVVPLRFTANKKIRSAGRYFFRAYTIIDGKHFWTDEQTLEVKKVPINEIKIINYSPEFSQGESSAFTWDITGPDGTTGYTAILYGKESNPGILDSTVAVSETPYSVLVTDYTAGSFNIPLRFVGNVTISEPGVYYFRALSIVNEKNIWSDEKSFTVR